MGKCRLYYDLISSSLGFLLSVSAFVVFVIYNNIQAGCWAGLSGILCSICLELHIVHWKNLLDRNCSPQRLKFLQGFGFIIMPTGLAMTIWYIFAIMYWHTPMLPVEGSLHVCAVWSFITTKWGLALYLTSRRYSSILNSNFSTFTPLNHSF